MLSHEEESSLAEIEARLRNESPQFTALFEDDPELRTDDGHLLLPWHPPETGSTEPRWRDERPGLGRGSRLVLALVAAVVFTVAATLLAGPDLGGLVGAAALPVAGLYGWSLFGCPGANANIPPPPRR